MKLKPNDFRKLVVGSFLAVPALSSLISTIHIITFFGLGNMTWMAIILALAFEIGSIASLMTLAVLDKINRFAVWFIFVVLVAMQMLGNVYYTYDYISQAMVSNPQWIDSFIDLVEMMTMQKLEQRTTKFILSLLIGLPIPIISLAFLKSVSDYLKPETKEKKQERVEEPKDELEKTPIDVVEINTETEIVEDTQPIKDINDVVEERNKDEVEVLEKEVISNPIEILNDGNNEKEIVQETKNSEVIYTNESIEETIIDKKEEIVEEQLDTTLEVNEEIVQHEKKEDEISEDIYEEEPNESFFDDTTIEEEHDDFIADEDTDEKKSQ